MKSEISVGLSQCKSLLHTLDWSNAKQNQRVKPMAQMAHLKWAFSEAAVLYLRGNDKARNYLNRLQKRMSKAKALSALAHKLGRCVYFMLKNKTVFDEQRFLKG